MRTLYNIKFIIHLIFFFPERLKTFFLSTPKFHTDWFKQSFFIINIKSKNLM